MLLPVGGDFSPYLDLYGRYVRDPSSVPEDWRLNFELFSHHPTGSSLSYLVENAIKAYEKWGHFIADLDPLGLMTRTEHPDLKMALNALSGHLDAKVRNPLQPSDPEISVRGMLALFEQIYAGPLALEFDHVSDAQERDWLRSSISNLALAETGEAMRRRILETIVGVDEFESFFRVRFPTKKRFGSEGCEAFLVFAEELVQVAASSKVDELIMGGMHRGRLCMLATVMGKPLREIIAEVKGYAQPGVVPYHIGDVPYHLGFADTRTIDGYDIRLSISPHPSHLSVIAPIVMGRARAKRDLFAGLEVQREAMPVIFHTDAAFSGQGVIAELFQLGQLEGYNVGGCVHFVINNNIGFTTTPSEGRSGYYCTDIGKMVGVPIIHVNGNHPEAVAKAAQLAVHWRQRFGKDILVELVCFRRHGHNELDEPRFTQPGMYEAVDRTPALRKSYVEYLQDKVSDANELDQELGAKYREQYTESYASIAASNTNRPAWLEGLWQGIKPAQAAELIAPLKTGFDAARLRELGEKISTTPTEIAANAKVAKFYNSRLRTLEEGHGINWATAEALAFATLLDDGHSVRLSGQDLVRGTFTQRHWEVHDPTSGERYLPLGHIGKSGAFVAINSPLSEFAVLGFEYGHSLVNPNNLTVWEAQFGDFCNGAQIVIDQFIVAGEAKWLRMSGLVMLLPHGLEGQGPEHSSCRPERWLQMCVDGNIIVVNCSTPANFFHVLRRQLVADYRKPMVVITPKSLLRNQECVSSIEEFTGDTNFRAVIDDQVLDKSKVDRVILCSGKIYYDLHKRQKDSGIVSALVRLEQLYPLPSDSIAEVLLGYPNAEFIWCQEEARNQGVWAFISERFATDIQPKLKDRRGLGYVGRKPCPAPAGGSFERHGEELAMIIDQAFGGKT
ncbi:MAG: 2-oxoglutarate dehydrogenase E1 component [Hyphomicrobiales bacterium]|nr:2-oxoglutarate dehydrogenase E1 component [Hyphomicrobiales bacterium]